jgi:hypothetical protein
MKPIYALVLMLSLTACGGERKEEAMTMTESTDMAPGNKEYVTTEASKLEESDAINNDLTGQVSPNLPDVVVPKLIRTAEDLEKSSEIIDQLVKQHGSYVSTANMSSTNTEANNTISVRVPNNEFDGLLKDVCKQSIYMQRKNVSVQDVTEEYVDIEARLKTKKEVEARYIEILKSKTKTVEDVLKAEEQIRIIREEIEAREGRLNYLKNQVNYSTITVQVYQQIEYRENPQELTDSFGNKATSGFGEGWNVIKNLVIGLITIWPLLIVGLIIYFVVRKQLRNNKKPRV